MVISSELGAALDELRKAVLEVESYLSEMPGVEDIGAVRCPDLDVDGENACIFLVNENGAVGICFGFLDSDAERPILSLPVSDRIRACSRIPELVATAEVKAKELPTEIRALATKISLCIV